MKKITILLVTASLFVGCEKDFLDLNPNDSPSSGTFWKTTEDYNQALTACYGIMQYPHFANGLSTWDNLTNNSYGQFDEGQYGLTVNLVQGNINPNSGGFVSNVYREAFKGVARVNLFMKNLENFSGIDDATKVKNMAEARMIRAFFYSYLYRCYGDVPIVSEPLDLETQFMAKSPADQVYNFMMEDLDFAIANLSDKTYSVEKGRWTQDAAKAYKARMILYTAYDASGNAIPSKMNEAQMVLSTISGYSLAPDFSDNFYDLLQESSPEIMMSVKYLAPNNFTRVDLWYGGWMVISPLVNFASEFEMLDGSAGETIPSTLGKIDVTTYTNASMAARDPRMAKTLFVEQYTNKGKLYTPYSDRPTGFGVAKFLSPNLDAPYEYATQSQQDWVIMRYADVLLMKAEVENELSGATSSVYGYVNEVRTRAGMPNLPAGLSKEDMRTRIRHERRIELAFEGGHYFDLKRWKTAKSVLNAVQDGMLTYKFEDKHYLWPLPQAQIDRSNGVLVQNPNYQ